jgi:hypothetical protein
MKNAVMNILKASAIWVAVVFTAGVISGYTNWNEDQVSMAFMQSVKSHNGDAFDFLKVTKNGVDGEEDEVIFDSGRIEWGRVHIYIDMPGEYTIESSCSGIENMPATLCFDEEWVQANLALGKARVVNNIVWVDSRKGGVAPLPDQETIHEADLLSL